MKKNATIIYRCYSCEKKFKESDEINVLRTISGKRNLCPFCFNYMKPKIKWVTIVFIIAFLIIGCVELINSFFLSDLKLINNVIAYSYMVLLPVFLILELIFSKKKLGNKAM